MSVERTVLCWSSGKDSAYSLHVLRQRADVEVIALLSTVNETHERVAMHAVRRSLLALQAEAAGVDLWEVGIPHPCDNSTYEARMRAAVERALAAGATAMAFGDLFLGDVRAYRERMLAGTGLEPVFPLWGRDTRTLAREMVANGVRAVLTCVDPGKLDPSFAGRRFDAELLDALPSGVDPCGERGEFHTFVTDGPMLKAPLSVSVGPVLERDGFVFADVVPSGTA